MNAPQRQAPEILPAVREAVQVVVDTIAAQAEDVHAAAYQLNGALQMLNASFQRASQEAVADLDAMIMAKRQAKRADGARERLAAAVTPTKNRKGR